MPMWKAIIVGAICGVPVGVIVGLLCSAYLDRMRCRADQEAYERRIARAASSAGRRHLR